MDGPYDGADRGFFSVKMPMGEGFWGGIFSFFPTKPVLFFLWKCDKI